MPRGREEYGKVQFYTTNAVGIWHLCPLVDRCKTADSFVQVSGVLWRLSYWTLLTASHCCLYLCQSLFTKGVHSKRCCGNAKRSAVHLKQNYAKSILCI